MALVCAWWSKRVVSQRRVRLCCWLLVPKKQHHTYSPVIRLLPSYPTVVSLFSCPHSLPPPTMADSYYENQSHSPSPQGEQYSNDKIHHSERIASPNGGGVSTEGYLANKNTEPTPMAAAPARKKLSSWVGFSNLPNQVHRRSVR